MSEVRQHIKVDSDGQGCLVDNCYQRFPIDGGRGGYVIRGTTPDPAISTDIAARHGAPGPGEFDLWVPPPVIEG